MSGVFVQVAFDIMERGFAVFVYDGPGQGMVVRNPPHTPFTPNWDGVLDAVLDYIESDFESYVDMNSVYSEAWSLGGFLGTQFVLASVFLQFSFSFIELVRRCLRD